MVKKILYVDDESINLDLFRINYDQEYEIFTTEFPREGLQIIQKENISVVVTDFKMPDINGLEFVELIKKLNPNVMCIVLSGFLESTISKDSELVFKHIMKPYKKNQMREAIEQAFEHSQLNKNNV
ncbi:MAG: response regulator [Bacteroidales bacterium]